MIFARVFAVCAAQGLLSDLVVSLPSFTYDVFDLVTLYLCLYVHFVRLITLSDEINVFMERTMHFSVCGPLEGIYTCSCQF